MRNLESARENKTQKVLWDFERQTRHLISAGQLDLVIVYKKMGTCRLVNFASPVDNRIKLKESKIRDKYVDLAREPKNL